MTWYRYAHFAWCYLVGFVYARWKSRIDPHLRAYLVPALVLGIVLGLRAVDPCVFGKPPPHILSGPLARSLQKFLFLVPVLFVANRLKSTRLAFFDALATYSFTLFFLHYFFVHDYINLQAWIVSAVNPGPFAQGCIRVALAGVFVAQNLLLAILLNKATGRWSRPLTGS